MGKPGLATILALVILVGLLLLAIVFMAVGWNTPEGGEQMSIGGWIAMILGVIATLALGIGLMTLMFYSSRSGRD
ncbi:MAG TPA: hypothetical protein VGM96_25725 [Reyranella sp.]|jgi:hypothetical protein